MANLINFIIPTLSRTFRKAMAVGTLALICLTCLSAAAKEKIVKEAVSSNSATPIWAVNCGGDAHIDSNGVHYEKDFLNVGVASDYGRSLGQIGRVHAQDQIIYQTERYNTANFGYEVPLPPRDGSYVLVLKFSEVWFAAPHQKVFDVTLNAEHQIVKHLDIYSSVGRGTAHDEIIPFKVKDGKLHVMGESSELYLNRIAVEFIKGDYDNPKVNAIILYKGEVEGVPKLPPLSASHQQHSAASNSPGGGARDQQRRGLRDDDEAEDEERDHNQQQQQQQQQQQRDSDWMRDGKASGAGSPPHAGQQQQHTQHQDAAKKRKVIASGPKTPDPYASDETSSMLVPVLLAIGAFLPIVFCLCKL